MTEIIRPRGEQKEPRPHRRLKLLDVVLTIVFTVVIVALGVYLFNLLQLRQEVLGARSITDRVANDISTKNAKDALSVADSKFKTVHSKAQLDSLFTEAGGYINGNRTIAEKVVSNDSHADEVRIIYKYAAKKPYYIRVTATKTAGSGTWQLTGLSGNSSASALSQ